VCSLEAKVFRDEPLARAPYCMSKKRKSCIRAKGVVICWIATLAAGELEVDEGRLGTGRKGNSP
jgi:hypothetical protein